MKKVEIFLCTLIFVLIALIIAPFQFGVRDNTEELPLIYETLGIASYPNDSYVEFHSTNFTQAVPYTLGLSAIKRAFPFVPLSVIFFCINTVVIALLYIAVRKMLRHIAAPSEYTVLLCSLGIFVLQKAFYSLFIPYFGFIPSVLDPTFMGGVIAILMIALYLEKNSALFLASLFVATLVHPTTSMLLFPGIVAMYIARRFTKQASSNDTIIMIGASVFMAMYGFLLWQTSHQTVLSTLNISAIFTLHDNSTPLPLPRLFTDWQFIDGFFYATCGLFCIGVVRAMLYKKYTQPLTEILSCMATLLAVLLCISAIGEWKEVDVFVLIKPYHISAIVVLIGWVIAFGTLVRSFDVSKRISIPLLSLSVLGLGVVLHTNTEEKKPAPIDGVVEWIVQHTNASDLFLNYAETRTRTGLNDLRTLAHRPVYFGLSSFPLTIDEEIAWYHQYLIQKDLPADTKPEDLKRFEWGKNPINLTRVIANIDAPIRYILIPKKILTNITHTMTTAYEDNAFIILQVP
jgi:hypothetical protein